MMYLRFQIILSFGLIYPALAVITFDQVISYLSSTNLPHAQVKFQNCMSNLNINDFEQINNDEINTFLNTLSDNIISRRIYPEEMSQEFIEFFKLDKFIIKDKLNECFKIFQSNLFAIKKPK
ncbi:uncharacterized protein LOC126909009, partial [Daktulosphaira vitifoliae]|uniref:uncharacterized protein LOC126909009 n=1 Tax=Daktulosphaira vitifoliae TaxID=58002 RepID=UPI0021AA3F68